MQTKLSTQPVGYTPAGMSRMVKAVSNSMNTPRTCLSCFFILLAVVVLVNHWRPEPYMEHPTTLAGWQLQHPAGTPYLGSNSRFTSAPAAAEKQRASAKPLGPTTDAPMKVLPPFEPTCIADKLDRMETWGCPVMFCSLDPSCTIYNTSCCAFLHYQMLSFLHDFLASKCLLDEYLAMFGTGLGAVRNHTIIPWTEDLDVGITPLALQFLELNSTREELWRHGYTVWHHQCKCRVQGAGCCIVCAGYPSR